jgi:N-acetylglucosamine-6-phosphate deacetylase
MPTTALVAERVYTPDEIVGPTAVVVADGRIQEVVTDLDRARRLAAVVVDLRPWRLAPGYIDLHTHGFAGFDVTSGSEADLLAMASALPATGVTAFLPTIASTSPTDTRRQVQHVASARQRVDQHTAEILGIRLEGPFINPARKGAHDPAMLRPPDPAELTELLNLGPIRLVDLAPELDVDFRLLRTLVDHDVVACIGHTAATYEEALAAIGSGVRHCTHLFNAMPPLEHRAPGAAGALLSDRRATVEIIADGVHVHPGAIRVAVAARWPHAIALVTDAMSAAGLPPGDYTFLGRHVVARDGAVRLADGTLAGSILTMDQAVRNMVNLAEVAWQDAIRMATATPASVSGDDYRKGSIRPGLDADLVALDADGRVMRTWRSGEVAFQLSG